MFHTFTLKSTLQLKPLPAQRTRRLQWAVPKTALRPVPLPHHQFGLGLWTLRPHPPVRIKALYVRRDSSSARFECALSHDASLWYGSGCVCAGAGSARARSAAAPLFAFDTAVRARRIGIAAVCTLFPSPRHSIAQRQPRLARRSEKQRIRCNCVCTRARPLLLPSHLMWISVARFAGESESQMLHAQRSIATSLLRQSSGASVAADSAAAQTAAGSMAPTQSEQQQKQIASAAEAIQPQTPDQIRSEADKVCVNCSISSANTRSQRPLCAVGCDHSSAYAR